MLDTGFVVCEHAFRDGKDLSMPMLSPHMRPTPIAASLALATSLLISPGTAVAEDIDTEPTADELQQQVERTAEAYDEAVVAAQASEAALVENEERIAELEALIPKQQERCRAIAREMYKMQQQTPDIIELILSSDDFFDFLDSLEYVNRVTQANADEMARLKDLKSELDRDRSMLEETKNAADESVAEAERALMSAQTARLEAQRRAQEAERQAAEARAIAMAAQTETSEPEPQTTAAPEITAESETTVADGVDWSNDEAAFVESWGSRIDAYLEGSPLSGQGRTFAQAAWTYGVDPRWSPAISYTESSLGAVCFLPHNAWGWGSVSWDSWEEAIDAHVRGLARGYGYTISMEAAYKYCPSGPEHWYETTLGQMNLI